VIPYGRRYSMSFDPLYWTVEDHGISRKSRSTAVSSGRGVHGEKNFQTVQIPGILCPEGRTDTVKWPNFVPESENLGTKSASPMELRQDNNKKRSYTSKRH
jgi:hypothetical protein